MNSAIVTNPGLVASTLWARTYLPLCQGYRRDELETTGHGIIES